MFKMSYKTEIEDIDIFNEKCIFCNGKYVYDSTENLIYCDDCGRSP